MVALNLNKLLTYLLKVDFSSHLFIHDLFIIHGMIVNWSFSNCVFRVVSTATQPPNTRGRKVRQL